MVNTVMPIRNSLLAAEQVAEPAAGHEARGVGEGVAGHDELETAVTHVQAR